jgi:hypothetical protein
MRPCFVKTCFTVAPDECADADCVPLYGSDARDTVHVVVPPPAVTVIISLVFALSATSRIRKGAVAGNAEADATVRLVAPEEIPLASVVVAAFASPSAT